MTRDTWTAADYRGFRAALGADPDDPPDDDTADYEPPVVTDDDAA